MTSCAVEQPDPHKDESRKNPNNPAGLDQEMLSDLQTFLDGQPFVVNQKRDLYFTPGGDEGSPLKIDMIAMFPKGDNTHYDLVIRFAQLIDQKQSTRLTGDGIELAAVPKDAPTEDPHCATVDSSGMLRIRGLEAGKHYVFSLGSGVLAGISAPSLELEAEACKIPERSPEGKLTFSSSESEAR